MRQMAAGGGAITKVAAKTTVGVSLLAMAVCQSTHMLADTPLSRAGSLLQGDCGVICRRWRWPRPAVPGAWRRSRRHWPGPS
ncbi:hypothetical protein FE275_02170 [Pseudomonas koreensis]|nr:hypothetical protein FE275_02170 [Pseudomonas koreensis]